MTQKSFEVQFSSGSTPSTLEVFRPITPTERSLTIFGALQNYVSTFLGERNIQSGHSVALDGLRMVLYPPQSLAQIRNVHPKINNTDHARTRVKSWLNKYQPSAFEPIPEVSAPTCPILRLGKTGHVVLLFHDKTLIDEQRYIYSAVEGNIDITGKKHPMIPLFALPELDRQLTRSLTQRLDSVVRDLRVGLEPVQCELIGPTI